MFNFLSQPTNVLGGVGDWLGKAGSAVGDFAVGAIKNVMGGNSNNDYIKYSNPGGVASNTAKTSSAQSDWAKESANLQQQLRNLQNSLAQQPKLPNFDIMANYNKAKQTASAAVTPLYNKKLNIFLEGQGIKKTAKTQNRDLAFENSQIAEANALADNANSRVRTGEDLQGALDQIAYGRDNFLVDDAQQFDDARRALQEEVAAGGSTDTGLGQQAVGRQQDDRNVSSERQMTAFSNEEAAKNLLANRTFQDLVTSDDRNKQKRTQDDKATTIDFDSYMSSLANEETSFRLTNDLEMALEMARQTSSYQQQGVAEFLAGLSGQGYRPQDIALAAQVYR